MIQEFDAGWCQQVLDHLGQGVTILNDAACLVWCNRAYAQITGFSRQDHIGQVPPHIVDHALLLRRAKLKLNATGHWQGEIGGINQQGEPLALLVNLSYIPNPHGGPHWLLEHFFEIDSYLNYIKQLESQALHDPLSGLPNRSYFRSEINGAFQVHQQSAGVIAVMFIDLDGFKQINDRAGHETGDYVITIVAQRLRHIAKQCHGFAARMGGDEFALLLMDSEAKQVEEVAQTLLADIERPITVDCVEKGHFLKKGLFIKIIFLLKQLVKS